MVFSIFRVVGASPNFLEHSHELNRYFPVAHRKESACSTGEPGLNAGSGRSSGAGHGNPFHGEWSIPILAWTIP